MAENYVLRVTAGPGYALPSHTEVPVNTPTPITISHPDMDIELNVRVQNYRGLPRNSPRTSPYFSAEPHKSNGDLYSIGIRFTPKRPSRPEEEGGAEGISGSDLQFGNDFDHPIRDRLPPGFNTALNIVKWWIDPGLDGDAYSDRPHLYGPALSSFNAVHAGKGTHDPEKGGLWFEEGGEEGRNRFGAPAEGKERMKWALKEESKKGWVWEYGKSYGVDFYNPYVDFDRFALKLPGFYLPIIKYWDGQGLRYVLRNRTTGTVYLVVLFTLYLKEDVNEDGSLKPAALRATGQASGGEGKIGRPMGEDGKGDDDDESFDEEKAIEEARRKLSTADGKGDKVETQADDVD